MGWEETRPRSGSELWGRRDEEGPHPPRFIDRVTPLAAALAYSPPYLFLPSSSSSSFLSVFFSLSWTRRNSIIVLSYSRCFSWSAKISRGEGGGGEMERNSSTTFEEIRVQRTGKKKKKGQLATRELFISATLSQERESKTRGRYRSSALAQRRVAGNDEGDADSLRLGSKGSRVRTIPREHSQLLFYAPIRPAISSFLLTRLFLICAGERTRGYSKPREPGRGTEKKRKRIPALARVQAPGLAAPR